MRQRAMAEAGIALPALGSGKHGTPSQRIVAVC